MYTREHARDVANDGGATGVGCTSRRRRSPNRCYTGGCFIARFAAWPPRVTRLTEILIESETTPSQRVPHHRRTDSFLVYGSAPFQPPSSRRPPLPLLDGLSESEEDWGWGNRAGRNGREVDPGTASLRWKKKTGAYILSVYKRDGKADEEEEGMKRGKGGSDLKGDLWILPTEKSVSLPRYYVDFSLSFSLVPSGRLRNDSCVAMPLVYIRVVSGRRTIVRNDRERRGCLRRLTLMNICKIVYKTHTHT